MHLELLGIVVILLGPTDVREHLPEQLLQVMESRTTKTSQIEWTITHRHGWDAGLTERHITRTDGDTVWQVNLGDENGYHPASFLRRPKDKSRAAWVEAAIPQEEDAGERHRLLHDGQMWKAKHSGRTPPLTAFAAPQDGRWAIYHPFDFTTAGTTPRWFHAPRTALGLDNDSLVGFEDATYSTASHGSIVKVTAEFRGKSIEWQLDNRRGGCPVEATFYENGALRNWSRTELMEVDGRWLPSSIDFYAGDDPEPYQTISVQKASFDEPWHVKGITPNDIGILFGTQIFGHEGQGYNRWDGTRLISHDEYEDLIYLYGLRPHPFINERLAKGSGMTLEEWNARTDADMERRRAKYLEKHGESPWLMKKSETPDDWDIYVAEFVKKHKLDKPRVKRAEELLAKAKKLREYWKRKNRHEIAKAEKSGDTEKLEQYEAITQRIFERVLVRGLKKLIPDKPEKPTTDSKD